MNVVYVHASEITLLVGLILAVLVATAFIVFSDSRDIRIAGPIVSFVFITMFSGLISDAGDQWSCDKVIDKFSEYYNVRLIEGSIPAKDMYGVGNNPTNVELYFNEDGALLDCTITVVDDKYTGYCEDGRTL